MAHSHAVGSPHEAFELYGWTFYPTTDMLLKLIKVEEAQLVKREREISAGKADPGRPTYSESYDWLVWPVEYSTIFNDTALECELPFNRGDTMYQKGLMGSAQAHLPLLPPLPLLLHPNIVIFERTAALAKGICQSPGAFVNHLLLFVSGSYSMCRTSFS